MKLFSKETYQERRNRLKKDPFRAGSLLFLGNEESSSNLQDNWYPIQAGQLFFELVFGLDVTLVLVGDL